MNFSCEGPKIRAQTNGIRIKGRQRSFIFTLSIGRSTEHMKREESGGIFEAGYFEENDASGCQGCRAENQGSQARPLLFLCWQRYLRRQHPQSGAPLAAPECSLHLPVTIEVRQTNLRTGHVRRFCNIIEQNFSKAHEDFQHYWVRPNLISSSDYVLAGRPLWKKI